MERNYVIVKKVFTISGRGVGIVPEESLSPIYLAKKYKVLLEYPNGEQQQSHAFVEALLISATKRIELFTFFLPDFKSGEIPVNTKITIIVE